MSTETIDTIPQPAPEPAWKADLQQAMNATWKTIGIPTAAAPFFTGQKTWRRDGAYVAEIGYLLLDPVLQIAAAYDVTVTETQGAGGTTYKAVVPVDGVDVHVWTSNPADTPAVTE